LQKTKTRNVDIALAQRTSVLSTPPSERERERERASERKREREREREKQEDSDGKDTSRRDENYL